MKLVMNNNMKRIGINLVSVSMLILTLFMGVSISCAEGPEGAQSGLSDAEAAKLGERMYRTGILPSGKPMNAVIKDDINVDGTAFTCVSCHLRGGLGAREGGVVTPPTNGVNLYKPLKSYFKGVEITAEPPRRPAYTDASLAETLRTGVDPSGRKLHEVMPRYLMDDQDMTILISYLKTLSSTLSPGAGDMTLKLATVISEDANPEDRDAMISTLEACINNKNNQTEGYKMHPKQAQMAENMLGSKSAAYVKLSLTRWILKGPSSTWRAQLEEYNRTDPSFALVGGIVSGDWKPIHDFCEENRIPCIFPVTDYPVISDTDWYTLYLSKGFYQEGETAARYLGSREDMPADAIILEVVTDSPKGRAMAEGFLKTWKALERKPPVIVTIKDGQKMDAGFLVKLADKEKPTAMVVWGGSDAIPAITKLNEDKRQPGLVVVSYEFWGKDIWTLDGKLRSFVYMTYPFRLPQDEAKIKSYAYVPQFLVAKYTGDPQVIMKRTYCVMPVLSQALMDMRGNYYRDNLMDVTGMMMDTIGPLYERMSFGPGQRYASKGCYVVQLSAGMRPILVKKSDWVIH